MKITSIAALELATESTLHSMDVRVWAAFIDRKATPAEVSRLIGMERSNTAASCRRLYYAGWLDLIDTVGRAKKYTARCERSKHAPDRNQTTIEQLLKQGKKREAHQ